MTKAAVSQGIRSEVLHRYDALSRLVAEETSLETSPGNLRPFRTVSYTYTEAGDRLTMGTDHAPLGLWTYGHDQDHLLRSLSHSSGESHQWAYDGGMRPVRHTMPNGAVEHRRYDNKERLQRMGVVAPGMQVLSDLSYTFDRVDNRKTITYRHLGNAVQAFDYDGEYRLVHERLSGGSLPGYEACYAYDGAGNRLLKTVGERLTQSVYDDENRLTTEMAFSGFGSLTAANVTASSTAAGFTTAPITDGDTTDGLDPAHAWASESLPGTQHRVVLDLGASHLVGRIKLWLPTGNGLAQRFKAQYFDGNAFQDFPGVVVSGAVASSTPGWFTQTEHGVVFDCAAISTTQVAFVQDAGGGAQLSADQAYVNEMQVFEPTGGSLTSLAYDPAGALLSETSPSGAISYGYDWDYRLRTYTAPGVQGLYVSDALGRRAARRVTGTNPLQELYAYDGEDILGDYAAPNSLRTRYTNGEGVDQKLSLTQGGQSYQYVPDALGSTHELLDASRSVVNRYVTDAWGVSILRTEGTANRIQWTGREFNAETGFNHHGQREEMLSRGGWLQRDPAHQGLNQRIYAGDNPSNFTDPTGMILQIHGENVTSSHVWYRALTNLSAHDPQKADVEVQALLDALIGSDKLYDFTSWDEVSANVTHYKAKLGRDRQNARFARARATMDNPALLEQDLHAAMQEGLGTAGQFLGSVSEDVAITFLLGPALKVGVGAGARAFQPLRYSKFATAAAGVTAEAGLSQAAKFEKFLAQGDALVAAPSPLLFLFLPPPQF